MVMTILRSNCVLDTMIVNLKKKTSIKPTSTHYQRTFSAPDELFPIHKICAARTRHQSGMDALVRFYEWERAYLVKAEYYLRSAFAMFEGYKVPTRFPRSRE